MPITQGGSDTINSTQLRSCHVRTYELGLAGFIDSVNGKDGLGQIDANVQNSHGLPLSE